MAQKTSQRELKVLFLIIFAFQSSGPKDDLKEPFFRPEKSFKTSISVDVKPYWSLDII